MIKLKDLLNEQIMDWKSIVDTIPTKFPNALEKIRKNNKSVEAVSKFSDEAKQMAADKFDKFVEKNGEAKVKRRGTMRAGFNQLPAEPVEPQERDPQNETFKINCEAQFADNIGTSSTIDQDVLKSIQNYISQRKSSLQQQYPDASSIDIGLVYYSIVSTTSKVPSRNPGNPKLVEQRYQSMKNAYINAVTALKLPSAPGKEDESIRKPNIGPTWEDVKDNYKKQVVNGKVVKVNLNGVTMAKRVDANGNDTTTAYEERFADSRRSYITFTVDIEINFPREEGEEGEGAKQEKIRFFLKSRKFNFRLRLPSIRLGLPNLKMSSTKVPKPGKCPAFTKKTGKKSRLKPGIKTPMGRM